MKKILVTGGAGFIGTNLIKELKSRGHHVFASDLYNTEREDYIRCDVRNYRQLVMLFEEYGPFDYVYHLAAEYGRWNGEAYYENLWQTNIIGVKHLIRLQEKYGFRMVFFSSAEVYGDYKGKMKESVMENEPIKLTYQMNDYAISKWAGELICLNSAKMYGTETVRVRPVNCYGPYEEYTPYRGFIPSKGKELRNGAFAVGVSNILGYIVLVHIFGTKGAAITMMISGLIYCYMMYFFYMEYRKLQMDLKK